MIALTKEMREELAKFAKATLNSLNGIEPEDPNQYDDCLSEYTQKCMKIALASLTAEEVNQVIFNNHLDDGYVEWADCNKDYFNRNPSDYRRVLYTAPPVPEIKLPPEFNESHDSFNEFRRGWNGAISEFKRTNGLGD